MGNIPILGHPEYGFVSCEQVVSIVGRADIDEAYKIAVNTGTWAPFIALVVATGDFKLVQSNGNSGHLFDEVPGQQPVYDR